MLLSLFFSLSADPETQEEEDKWPGKTDVKVAQRQERGETLAASKEGKVRISGPSFRRRRREQERELEMMDGRMH